MTVTTTSTPATLPAGTGPAEVTKYHGLGNDFLVVWDPGRAVDLDAGVARALCDRHTGVGADGLIRAAAGRPGSGAALTFELWNADGGMAEMSGNGMRCLAQAALEAGAVTPGEAFVVSTPAGPRAVTVRPGTRPDEVWAAVGMGPVDIQGDADRCNVGHGQLRVDVGNPHLVILGPDPAGVDVAGLGPALERSEPQGLNVEFVTLGPGPDEVTMRVWERGVGETRACGTGATAAATAMAHWGRVGRAVTVHQPGGPVAVTLLDDGTAVLAGPSRRVARCVLG